MTGLPKAAERVAAALAEAGVTAEIVEMPASTRTAEEAAVACGCPLGAIVKSLMFRAGETGVLVLTSGANRVDTGKAGAAAGLDLGKADPDFVRAVTGFAIGGVPPLAHATPCRVVMDRDLLAFPTVRAAAGTPRTVFAIAPQRLAEITGATIADIA